MKNRLPLFKILSISLWTIPLVISLIYLALPIVPSCPVNLLSNSEALIITGILLGIFWVLALFWTIWYKHNAKKTPIPSISKRAILGGVLTFLLFGTAMAYAGSQIGSKLLIWNEQRRNLANNTVSVVFESDAYNAFPRLLKLQNGSLWTVWYQGNWHIDSNNDGKLIQAFSYDNGSTWQQAVIAADDPTYDTRNPAIGQLADGTLVLMIFEYDGSTRKGIRSEWSLSKDGGITWSKPKEINTTQVNPSFEPTRLTWISPFGNLFLMNGHYVALFYGGNGVSTSELQDQHVLLEYLPAEDRWVHYATPMGDSIRGYNEGDIEWVGDRWLCVSRTSENILYYATSTNGINWTAPKSTGLDKGHSPELVVIKQKDGTWQCFCCYRAERGFLRGGKAYYTPASDNFTCEDQILYTTEGKGGIDANYPSAVLFDNQTVGFVNYDVVVCCDNGCTRGTYGKILWQVWTWS